MPLKEAFPAGSQEGQSLNAEPESSAGLATLPTETLILIFSNFCLHCHKTLKPDADGAGTDISSLSGTHSCSQRQQHRQSPGEPSWYSLDRHALFSLCLMSRRFRAIAQPILYHEFTLGAGDSWRSTRYAWDGRLPSFLRTAAERRDLAGLVQRVYVHPFLLEKWCAMVDGQVDKASAAAAMVTLHHSARVLGVQPEHYLDQFPKPHPRTTGIERETLRVRSYQLLGLVIAALPKMEHLSLQMSRFSGRVKICSAAALEAAGVTGLCLKSLGVCLHSDVDLRLLTVFDLYPEAMGLLEKSPSLSTLSLHRCSSTRHSTSLPNLSVLRITNSSLSKGDLVAKLSSCSQLTTFLYEEAYPGTQPQVAYIRGETPCQPADAINLLGLPNNTLISWHLQNKTLKSLHLDFRNAAVRSPALDPFIQPIPSLKGFTALEHVFLNPGMIFPARYDGEGALATTDHLTQLLPATIVTLQLAGRLGRARPWLTRALLGLAHAVSGGALDCLREVSCDEVEESLAGDGEWEAARLFEDAGVRFGYRIWPQS